ncbi:MAG: hypothetical protein WC560_10710 [Syntrophales bacterium]
MAANVINEGEVLLNSVKYPIEGVVRPQLLSRFPAKIITGDSSYDNQNELSNWIIRNQSGGLGIEEMDESVHADRNLFTNCIVDYPGHIRLPRLATGVTLPTMPAIADGGMEIWTNPTTLTNWTAVVKDPDKESGAGNVYAGTYSAKIDTSGGGGAAYIYQAVTTIATIAGKRFTFKAYVKTASATMARVAITTDGTAGTTTYSDYHTGGGTFEQLSVSAVVPSDATYVRVACHCANTGIAYFDAATVPSLTGGTFGLCNFNSNLYLWANTVILKLNTSTGNAFTYVGDVGTAITDMVSSINSRMYVAVGDTTKYWYMSTVEVFTQAPGATSLANWFLQWDGKLQEFRTDGTSFYSTDPDAGGGGATWTAYGTVTDIPAAKLRKSVIYQDTDGNDIIYWPNSIILKAHDATNTKYVDTKVKLSDHPNGAKGCLFWQDALYISQGLQVKKYVIGSTASLTDVGLDRDDGLMAEYNGEIVKLVEGETEMYALVDAAETTSGNCQSTIIGYDGKGWRVIWSDPDLRQHLYDAIISTAYGYRLWFIYSSTPNVAYIDLQRGLKNPSQLSSVLKYATSGIWISPWFDAGTPVYTKCLKQVTTFCKNITATETVVVKYRTNHTNIDRDTGWTTLATLDTTGENNKVETQLASGAGVTFSAIQFRLDLVRGSTTTATPDVQALVSSYLKNTDPTYGWTFTVTCGENYHIKSPKALYEALATAIASETLITFLFRDNASTQTHYVKITGFNGIQETGHGYYGKYAVSVVEP